DRLEHLLRVAEELVAVGDEVGLAADGDHRPLRAVLGEAVADLPFGRCTVGALRRLRHAALAQEDDRRLHVAVRLLQGALAIHHPRTRLVAQLLDERSRDLGHYDCSSAVGSAASAEAAGSGSPASAALSATGSGSGFSAG